MTQDEIRKLLGGYATNALNADERRILFEAALEDQDLFNALQNEDALRELLADPVLRDQVRRAIEAPAARKGEVLWRRWALGVALPAVAAVIAIVVMNRANAPKLISMSQPAASHEVAPKLAEAPPAVAKKQSESARVPQAQAIPAPVQLESSRRFDSVISDFSVALVHPVIPAEVREQFSAGFPPDAPLYQGPLVQYSIARGSQDANAVRVDVSTSIPGYLALYRVDAAGNLKRVYPATDVATQVLPNIGMQIPIDPVKVDVGERLRLVLVPAAAPAVMGSLGGAVDAAAKPLQAPAAPLVIDIPLAP
jgi:hypothetical protein